jgi:hypothetical protein
MGKVVNITDKLSFDENPKLKIKDVEIEVKADARTMLEIMGLFNDKPELEATLGASEKLFSEEDRAKLDKMNLSFKDYMHVIGFAMETIQGEDSQGEDSQGEQ